MSLINSHVVCWFDEENLGEVQIGDEHYEYIPELPQHLPPNEIDRILIGKVEANHKNEKRGLQEYFCRVFTDGKMACDCPDWFYRRRPKGEMCKHLEALYGLGVIHESEAEKVAVETPW